MNNLPNQVPPSQNFFNPQSPHGQQQPLNSPIVAAAADALAAGNALAQLQYSPPIPSKTYNLVNVQVEALDIARELRLTPLNQKTIPFLESVIGRLYAYIPSYRQSLTPGAFLILMFETARGRSKKGETFLKAIDVVLECLNSGKSRDEIKESLAIFLRNGLITQEDTNLHQEAFNLVNDVLINLPQAFRAQNVLKQGAPVNRAAPLVPRGGAAASDAHQQNPRNQQPPYLNPQVNAAAAHALAADNAPLQPQHSPPTPPKTYPLASGERGALEIARGLRLTPTNEKTTPFLESVIDELYRHIPVYERRKRVPGGLLEQMLQAAATNGIKGETFVGAINVILECLDSGESREQIEEKLNVFLRGGLSSSDGTNLRQEAFDLVHRALSSLPQASQVQNALQQAAPSDPAGPSVAGGGAVAGPNAAGSGAAAAPSIQRQAHNVNLVALRALSRGAILDQHLGRLLGAGSFAEVHIFTFPENSDNSPYVIKLNHPREHYFAKYDVRSSVDDAQEQRKRCRAGISLKRAQNDIRNEVAILQHIHEVSSGIGVQLPYHRVVELEENGPNPDQVGSIGPRYDGDLFSDIADATSVDPTNPNSVIKKPITERMFCSPATASMLFNGLLTIEAAGVFHGDIKPENILVRRGPPPRIDIADFGGARTVETLRDLWNRLQPQIQHLKTQREYTFNRTERLNLDGDINSLCSEIVGTFSNGYSPNEMLLTERRLITTRFTTFEEWLTQARRRELHSLALTVNHMLDGYNLTGVQREILRCALDYRGQSRLTIQEVAARWSRTL